MLVIGNVRCVCTSEHFDKTENSAKYSIMKVMYVLWFLDFLEVGGQYNHESFQVSTETLRARTCSLAPSSASLGYMEARLSQARCPGTQDWQAWQVGEGPRPTHHPPPPLHCLQSSLGFRVNLRPLQVKGEERGDWGWAEVFLTQHSGGLLAPRSTFYSLKLKFSDELPCIWTWANRSCQASPASNSLRFFALLPSRGVDH